MNVYDMKAFKRLNRLLR